MHDSPDTKRGEGNGFSRLKTRDIKFHLYVSQCPCGDASTNQLLDQLNNVNRSTFLDVSGDKPTSSSLKRGCEQEEKHTDKRPPKKSRDICSSPNDSVDENKCVYNNQILVRGRSNFNILSTLRTKPGRADADSTLSMSCSDKIAMWNVTGIQNSILSSIIEPIYFSSIVIGDSTSYLKDSYRAFNQRIKNLDKGLVELPFKINEVEVCSADLEFSHSQGSIKTKHPEAKLIAADGSINWYRFEKTQNTQSGNGSGDGYSKNFVQNGILEVTVKGRLQGSPGISAAKKKQSQPPSDDCITLEKHRSKLCKLELCKRIVYLMSKYETLRAISAKNTNANTHPDTSLGEGHSISFKQTYKQLKSKSTQYQNAKRSLKESVFKSWVSKPGGLDDFIIE
ncbi:tRNA-specific adenosine deaminase 1 [Zancudomyces culisetae]|uniref:tRNA-specific adenosine deaminase 1 n=1 Tax=Zancudomyces culisetae TaxID=1213189 RepID=A0A1R1PPD5_ZANCU|nr:tRNA-specific adenosine deaminase 1 [Zancudomyces culisetae]|eukprot:OMH82827.1 tRNA-specific adenosine deaminase 1 [Zancudomyces culisetae]